MESVTVFLRTALFSLGGADSHLPAGVMVIDGKIVDRPAGALTVETSRLLDGRGRELGDQALTLQLPWAKIDHILARD